MMGVSKLNAAVAVRPAPPAPTRPAASPAGLVGGGPIVFPEGLLGLPGCRRFSLAPAGPPAAYWLHAVDGDDLTFLLVDPFLYFDGYHVELGPADLARLGTDRAGDLAALAIVTLARRPGQKSTANLQAPLVINLRERRGRQVVLASDERLRCPVDWGRASELASSA